MVEEPKSAAQDYAEAIAESEAPDYVATCKFKGCKLPARPGIYRRDDYCPNHQFLFRVTKKLKRVGYGQSRNVRPLQQTYGLGASPKTPVSIRGKSRPSKKGIWAAAEKVLANVRREAFRQQQEEAAAKGQLAEDGAVLVPANQVEAA